MKEFPGEARGLLHFCVCGIWEERAQLATVPTATANEKDPRAIFPGVLLVRG
jgi:hypothetical protein